MARPRKAREEQRSARVPHARLTLDELAFVEAQAAAAGLDPAEFVRRRLLGGKIAPARAVADERLIFEINRIGVNLNQISHAAHLGKTLEGKLSVVLDELRAVMARLVSRGP